ncbi:hypothetical protein K474DRAFT_1679245 [Panus rudis PR-1116 ss-1]|nr:hypothetical protein K474DRAFT_1679245 [Panus rudis PR-1116 ss-1]
MDLLQEHDNCQLKSMTQDRHTGFGGKFFRNIIAYNTRAFIESKEIMRKTLSLGRKSGSHQRKRKEVSLKELTRVMKERELHSFRLGRTASYQAKDDFMSGFELLCDGSRIKRFIERTLADATDIHGLMRGKENQQESGGSSDFNERKEQLSNSSTEDVVPLPNVVQNGVLIGAEEFSDNEEEFDEDFIGDAEALDVDMPAAGVVSDSNDSDGDVDVAA